MPSIKLDHLPAAEHSAVRELQNLVSSFADYVEHFQTALELFDDSERRARMDQKYRRRLLLAVRDGALTLFHFSKLLEKVGERLHKCPTLNAYVDGKALKAARRIFLDAVPQAGHVRHSVAHSAENSQRRKEHAATGPVEIGPGFAVIAGGGRYFVGSALHGRRYTSTVDNKIVSYELDHATLEALQTTVKAIFDLINKASVEQASAACAQVTDESR